MPEPHLRAADTDREAVAAALGKHMAAGRLTLAEYDERVAQAWAAKTYGELDALTADLPGTHRATTPARPAAPAVRPEASPAAGHGSCASSGDDVAQGWRAWAGVSAVVLTIWLLTGIFGTFGYFWPVWVIGPWGVAMLVRTVTGHSPGDRRGRLGA